MFVSLLIYLAIIAVGSLVTALIMVFGLKFDQAKAAKREAEEAALAA